MMEVSINYSLVIISIPVINFGVKIANNNNNNLVCKIFKSFKFIKFQFFSMNTWQLKKKQKTFLKYS